MSFSLVTGGEAALLHSEFGGEKSIADNSLDAAGSVRSTTIEANAFEGALGIIGVNQAAGHMNNQNNIVTMSIGDSPIVSLSDSDLGLVSTNNTVVESGVTKIDIISDNAFKGATGIISVNQSSGSMNNQVNIIIVNENLNLLGRITEQHLCSHLHPLGLQRLSYSTQIPLGLPVHLADSLRYQCLLRWLPRFLSTSG